MITITVFKHQDQYRGFRSSGHAGYAERGHDIVCAAVSALVQVFITSVDNQQAINVEIVQGNTKFVGDATPLGNLLIDNIPPGKSGEIIIKITLSISVRGLLACRVHISDLKSRFESIDRRIELDLSSVKESSKKMSHEEKMISRWRILASKRGGEFGDTLNAMIDSGRSREEIMKFISDNCGGANGC